MKQTGLEPSICSCTKCVDMCKHTPCIGTPQDILTLINNGHASSLSNTIWAAGLLNGIPPIDMVQLTATGDGCIMFDKLTGYCKLHDAGIKPIEGILASCDMALHIRNQIQLRKPSAAVAVAKSWINPANTRTIRLIERAMKLVKSTKL